MFIVDDITNSFIGKVAKWAYFKTLYSQYSVLYNKKSADCIRESNSPVISVLLSSSQYSLDFLVSRSLQFGFRLPIPDEYKSELEKYSFYTNINEGIANNSHIKSLLINFIKRYYPEIDVECFIKQHTSYVSAFFLEELNKGKSKSNNTILGVYDVSDTKKSLNFEFFTTDYFTYNCIVSMYKQLYSINSQPFVIKGLSDIRRIAPFLCCISIGGFVNIRYQHLNYSLLTKRSCAAACPNQWHSAFDETFDIRDHDNAQGVNHIPSFTECLKRGIWEELKIKLANHEVNMRNISFATVCTESRIECGIYLEVNIKIKRENELKSMLANTRFAYDADNETNFLTAVPYGEIVKFLQNKEDQGEIVTPESKFFASYFHLLNKKIKKIKLLRYLLSYDE
jgi:hypothetical protein